MMPASKPLTVKDVAALLKVTEEEVRRLCRKGILPASRHGRAYVIKLQAVGKYQEHRRRPGRPKKVV